MKIIKIQITKETENLTSDRNKILKAGTIIQGTKEGLQPYIESGVAKEMSLKGTSFQDIKQAEEFIEKTNKKK